MMSCKMPCPDCTGNMGLVKTNWDTPRGIERIFVCKNPECGTHAAFSLTYSHHTKRSPIKACKDANIAPHGGHIKKNAIFCPNCHHWAVIRRTNRVLPQMGSLHMTCQNPECGASFVCIQCYSHHVNRNTSSQIGMALSLLKALSPDERREAINTLSAS